MAPRPATVWHRASAPRPWGYGARTLGVFFERPPDGDKTATAGYYNTVALDEFARRDALFAAHVNGDAFSDECTNEKLLPSCAASSRRSIDLSHLQLGFRPKRTHPRTGIAYSSVLKPIGAPYSSRTIELDSGKVVDVTLSPASDKEIADTVAVMGGEDWRMWIEALAGVGLLAPGVRTVAYSYIGPELTWPIYRDGTIGRAKIDLDATARTLDEMLAHKLGGRALVSVNKAVVTQASSAIPVVPLYLSLLLRVLQEKRLDENPIEQIRRLFTDFLVKGTEPATDRAGRIRLDDRKCAPKCRRQSPRSSPR